MAVDEHLQSPIDRMDEQGGLTTNERREADRLADLAEPLSLLQRRATCLAG